MGVKLTQIGFYVNISYHLTVEGDVPEYIKVINSEVMSLRMHRRARIDLSRWASGQPRQDRELFRINHGIGDVREIAQCPQCLVCGIAVIERKSGRAVGGDDAGLHPDIFDER